MATTPACGFLREQGNPPVLTRCDQQAIYQALADELGEYVPACADCAEGRQVKMPQG